MGSAATAGTRSRAEPGQLESANQVWQGEALSKKQGWKCVKKTAKGSLREKH